MMGDPRTTTNFTLLSRVLGNSDPQAYWDLPEAIDPMTAAGGGHSPYSTVEPHLSNDYQPLDLDYLLLFNGTNGTNYTSFIPASLKYVNRTQIIAYSLLFPFAAIGNLVVFVALFRNRHRKSRVNMMIMHLSLADMIVTFVFLPTEITWHVTIKWVFGNFGCKVYKFLSAFGFYLSSMVLVCISLDRYFAVLHPLKVNDAQRRGKIMLFFAWLISSVISLPQTVIFNVQLHPTIPDFYQCVTFGFFDSNNGGEMMYTILCISFLYFIPLTIIIIAYTRIILEITKKSKDTQQDYTREERYHGRLHLRRSNMSNIERARTRTLRMTFIIVMAFIWCWTPYALGTLWNFIDPETFYSMNQQVQDILFLIAVSNSVVNPIIYGRYSISCCRGLWNKAGNFCCYCCCCCCPCSAHPRIPEPHPPHNINSYKSNGHCNAASANTRSTIYNHSARDKMVVGVRLQDQIMGRYRKLPIEDDFPTQSIILDDISNSESLSSKELEALTGGAATDVPAAEVKAEASEGIAASKSEQKEIGHIEKGIVKVIGNEKTRDDKQDEHNRGNKDKQEKGYEVFTSSSSCEQVNRKVEGRRLVEISNGDPPSSSPKKIRKKSSEEILVMKDIKSTSTSVRNNNEKEVEGTSGASKSFSLSTLSFSSKGYSQETSEDPRRSPTPNGRHIKEILEVQVTKEGDFSDANYLILQRKSKGEDSTEGMEPLLPQAKPVGQGR